MAPEINQVILFTQSLSPGSQSQGIDSIAYCTLSPVISSRMKPAFVLAILVTSGLNVCAKPTTFKNFGLKIETVITLEMQGKTVTGTFESSEYGDNAVKETFTGEVVPPPKGKSGVYMEIHFSAKVPYEPPIEAKVLRWSLRIVKHRAHLFIPMKEQSYTGKTPKWVVSDVDFTPED